jgi:hypothetical protein
LERSSPGDRMPVGLATTSVMVVDCPSAPVVTNTVVTDSGTVVIVFPAVSVVVKVIGSVKENGLQEEVEEENVAEAVTPLERFGTGNPGSGPVLDGEEGG